MKITEEDFGQGYHLIILENKNKLVLSVSDLGVRVVCLKTNDQELVLGFDTTEEYTEKDPYTGASIGRIAGRIENGRFPLNGKTYQLAINPSTGHNLYDGSPGFELKKWSHVILNGENEAAVIFTTTSPDGEHGFLGTLDVEVYYTLTQDDIWRVITRGISDQDTLFDPVNHVCFNLTGDASQTIDQHKLWLNSEAYAPLRADSIPIGVKENTARNAFDFQTPKKLMTVFASNLDQKELVDGIDYPFFLKESGLDKEAARLTSPDEKTQVDITTDTSNMVILTANFGPEAPEMRGRKLAHHDGTTLETQTALGAERLSAFDSIHLKTGTAFETVTELRIKTREE